MTAPDYMVGCNNDECGWEGPWSRCKMLGSIGPLCPLCGETIEPFED